MQVLSTGLPPLDNQQDKKVEVQLKKVCDEFSSLFVSMLWKEMRNTVPKSEFIPKGTAEKIFQEMMDQETSKEMARNPGFGLSRTLYDQLKIGILPTKK